jgi:hypothetical protein
MMMRAILCVLSVCVIAIAQQTKPDSTKDQKWSITANWRARGEFYDWFDRDPSERGKYGFGASQLRLGIGQTRTRLEWFVEMEQPSLFNLPTDANAAAPLGALGLGANYYAANTERNDASIFLKQAYLGVKFGKELPALRFGRFEFVEGTEVVPKDTTLAALKRDHIAHRLIGNFAFSHVGRSFDGAHMSWTRGRNNFVAMGARATQGVFDLNGTPGLDVFVQYAAYTRQVGTERYPAEVRGFAIGYEDTRRVLKTDNRPQAVRTADTHDVLIGTYGGHYLQAAKTPVGTFDLLLWGALQNGSWGVQSHRAGAGAAEIGYRLSKLAWKPWFRMGYFRSSGDDNAGDGEHRTFFQVLPTPRIYARFPFYNAMNSQDEFVEVQVQPTSKLTISSTVHWLQLSSGQDLWYSGGGAFEDTSFGYAGRPSGGHTGLANAVDVSATYKFSREWSATAYFNYANGGGVTDNIYGSGSTAKFGYVELNWALPQR